MKRPALFLDRDGVINVDHGYVYRPENFEFIPGIFDLVRMANESEYRVVVVTNQAGIGRGYYSEAQFHALMEWMRARFVEQGARIDAVYFCPFHPDHGVGLYKRESEFRKPGPGMLLQAGLECDLAFEASVMVGDKLSDMQAAEAAGVAHRFLYRAEHSSDGITHVTDLAEVTKYLEAASAWNKLSTAPGRSSVR